MSGSKMALVGVLMATLIMLDVFFLGWVFVDQPLLGILEDLSSMLPLPNSTTTQNHG